MNNVIKQIIEKGWKKWWDKHHEDHTNYENAYFAGAQNIVDKMMIQWTGENLQDVLNFCGKTPLFGIWFDTFEEYESYVHSHNNIFKIFNNDGSHLEVPVGAWILKAPDGRVTASVSNFSLGKLIVTPVELSALRWSIENTSEGSWQRKAQELLIERLDS